MEVCKQKQCKNSISQLKHAEQNTRKPSPYILLDFLLLQLDTQPEYKLLEDRVGKTFDFSHIDCNLGYPIIENYGHSTTFQLEQLHEKP